MRSATSVRRSLADVGALVAFRLAGLRGRSRRAAFVGAAAVGVATITASIGPAYLPGAGGSPHAEDTLLVLPTLFLAFLVATTFALIAAGGGRELLPRDEGVAFPVGATADHLGALLLAPLNIAWLLQAWLLLGSTAFALGPRQLAAVQAAVLLWLVCGTAFAQAVAWAVEWVRRARAGVAIVRAAAAGLAACAAALVATGHVTDVLDASPTVQVVLVAVDGSTGSWLPWAIGVLALLSATLGAAALGARVNAAVTRRPPREELTEAGRAVVPRRSPRGELTALLRVDRGSVWRSVPLRRGFAVLALMPGLVAAAGRLEWAMLPVLPGLVAAGGALLFGVNAWCLDGTGAVWRDTLPVRPALAFGARAWVLLEVLGVATALTLALAATRVADRPTAAELASVLAAAVVVCLQVVARSMHWSVRRPFAMDLRSARGTPAPPSTMVGYSAYLACTSTITGLVFSTTATASDPSWALLIALPLALLALLRLVRTAAEWEQPQPRARVVATVSAR